MQSDVITGLLALAIMALIVLLVLFFNKGKSRAELWYLLAAQCAANGDACIQREKMLREYRDDIKTQLAEATK